MNDLPRELIEMISLFDAYELLLTNKRFYHMDFKQKVRSDNNRYKAWLAMRVFSIPHLLEQIIANGHDGLEKQRLALLLINKSIYQSWMARDLINKYKFDDLSTTIRIYAVNYNAMRIMSGMGSPLTYAY